MDGVKLNRMYGDWYHVSLDSGEHEISVDLNGNDHVPYMVDGIPVTASVTMLVE